MPGDNREPARVRLQQGRHGGACGNAARVKRTTIEGVVLDPLRKELLAPDRVRRMAAELLAAYIEHVTTGTAGPGN